jgi:hypothetical protein
MNYVLYLLLIKVFEIILIKIDLMVAYFILTTYKINNSLAIDSYVQDAWDKGKLISDSKLIKRIFCKFSQKVKVKLRNPLLKLPKNK